MGAEVRKDPGRQGDTDLFSALPRPFAWIVRFEYSNLWLGAAAGVTYLLVAVAMVAAVGRPSGLRWGDFLIGHVTYAVWFASVPIVIAIFVRGLARDARDLAPAMRAGAAGDAAFRREALTVTPAAVWIGAAIGLLMTIGVVQLMMSAGPARHLGGVFLTLRELAIELALNTTLAWGIAGALRLSRLTRERARPDLLDPRAFAPLARNGTRLAAVWLVIMAVGVPLSLVPPEGADHLARIGLVMSLALASLAGVVLVLPCRGAHELLRAAKQAELDEVRRQIAEARSTREDARLPGLLAWESRIEGISEWPIDAAVLSRTGLFVLLPLASWVGAAFVERMIDASFG